MNPITVDDWQMERGANRPYLTEEEAELTKEATMTELVVHPIKSRRRSMAATPILKAKEQVQPPETLVHRKPKLLFANERTLTQWLNNSFLISVFFSSVFVFVCCCLCMI